MSKSLLLLTKSLDIRKFFLGPIEFDIIQLDCKYMFFLTFSILLNDIPFPLMEMIKIIYTNPMFQNITAPSDPPLTNKPSCMGCQATAVNKACCDHLTIYLQYKSTKILEHKRLHVLLAISYILYISIQEIDLFSSVVSHNEVHICTPIHSYKSVCVQITIIEITIALFFYWELRACMYFNTSQKTFISMVQIQSI